jgi:hypothetical protein
MQVRMRKEEIMSEVFCKDILDWDKFPEYDIIWCDPPWEQKMVNYFETIMYKSGYKKPNNTIHKIITHLAKLCYVHKPIFIEYSINGHLEVLNIMIEHGHNHNATIYSNQENGKPYLILVFNYLGVLPDGNMQGFKIIDSICSVLNFNTIFDPFAGLGKTAKRFISNNKNYIGSEINPQRFNQLKKIVWHAQQ